MQYEEVARGLASADGLAPLGAVTEPRPFGAAPLLGLHGGGLGGGGGLLG